MLRNLEACLIPVISGQERSSNPPYIVGVAEQSGEVSLVEARQIQLYIHYVCQKRYGRTFADVVQQYSGLHRPYAAAEGCQTVTLFKRTHQDWAFHRPLNPVFFPPEDSARKFTLLQLLDYVATANGLLDMDLWGEWKLKHEILQSPRRARRRTRLRSVPVVPEP